MAWGKWKITSGKWNYIWTYLPEVIQSAIVAINMFHGQDKSFDKYIWSIQFCV